MDKNKILLIGAGKTGNCLLDEMLNHDKRYVGLMINSALGDMEKLPNFNLCQSYLIPGVNGTGRDRKIGAQYIKDRGESIIDTIAKYKQSTVAVFFTSVDGGTGSGATPLLIKALKKPFPDKKVILVAAMPRLSENKDSLENAKGFWNDLVDLRKKGLVDSVYLIDNNKRRTFDEINKEATKALDSAFSLNSYDIGGDIDQNDSMKVNTASGYNFIMELSDKYTRLEDSIDQSIKDSVFMLPTSYECDYMGAVLPKGIYDISELKSKFEVYNTDYCGFSQNKGLIVLSGLAIPKEGIELIQIALNDLEIRNSKRIKGNDDDLYVKVTKDKIDNEYKKESLENKYSKLVSSTTPSSDTLSEILDSDFWDD